MNTDFLVQQLQRGFHVTLGATATLVESLQDADKRELNLTKLNQNWDLLSEELAERGEQTEQEARIFVDTLIAQRESGSTATPTPTGSTVTDLTPTAPPDIQLELQELTAQIAAIRAELERLRAEDSPS